LYEGPSEPSICNSKTGDNKFTINNYPHPSIKYHFRFQKADDGFVAGMMCLYWKVDFFLQQRQQQPGNLELFWGQGRSIFYVFKMTNYCFRECVYFPAVKTPLASWCDGMVISIQLMKKLDSFTIMWSVFFGVRH